MAKNLNYSMREAEGVNILDLSGNLTVLTSDYFKTVLHNLAERESVILNLVNIQFVTASGLNALVNVSYYARENGNRVIVMSAGSELKDLIDYADFFNHLIFAESIPEGKTKIEFYT
ncbi:MAG TPA: STAS domain-containing protein [Spirochaetota bacterium]|nr:STAS domain-containing protein [Spirochaetota bacterium]HPJ33771.1 STAS domain-containing protein [Spirochaetota bacterium]